MWGEIELGVQGSLPCGGQWEIWEEGQREGRVQEEGWAQAGGGQPETRNMTELGENRSMDGRVEDGKQETLSDSNAHRPLTGATKEEPVHEYDKEGEERLRDEHGEGDDLCLSSTASAGHVGWRDLVLTEPGPDPEDGYDSNDDVACGGLCEQLWSPQGGTGPLLGAAEDAENGERWQADGGDTLREGQASPRICTWPHPRL